MQFILSCTKIKNLIALDTSKAVCSDTASIFVVTNGNVFATVNKKVLKLETGSVLITDKRDICFFSGSGMVVGFAFDSDEAINSGLTKLNKDSLSLLAAIKNTNGSMLYPLLELLLCIDREEVISAAIESRDTKLFSATVDFMADNIHTRIGVNEIAATFGISLSHIKRIFSAYAGIGAHDYFNLLKICRAKELLLQGESVTTTADKTGFANQAYFSAAFKRIAGISPKAFASKASKQSAARSTFVKTTSFNHNLNKTTNAKKDLPDYLL